MAKVKELKAQESFMEPAEEMDILNDVEYIEETTEDELFFNGPSNEEVDAWKLQYKTVYATEIDGSGVFVWRTLNRKEFKELMKIETTDPLAREEKLCDLCILWPEGLDEESFQEGDAGVPTILAEQIMERSGFAPIAGPVAL